MSLLNFSANFDWAQSAEKRPIPLFQSDIAAKNPVLFIGGVHGDEPEGVALAEGLLEWLKNHKANTPWAVIPCLNPDGFLRRRRTNGNGVDLNRNYPCKEWSSEHKSPRYFPGPHAGSESEIQSLVKWITEYRPRLIIHFHSWQPMVVYAGEGARLAAEELGRASGYEVKDDIGYPTPGSLSRFGLENNIPIICIEESDPTPREDVWPRFEKAFERILIRPGEVGLA
jgi:murein peptide amidase A